MLFSEIYGYYYHVVAQLLAEACEAPLSRERMYTIIREKGFEESILAIPRALEDQHWPLLKPDGSTPLRHAPSMPLSTLQKRWLKTLLSDPRLQLFDPPMAGLEEVAPLYPPGSIVYYDRYQDGDPYDDPDYRQRFGCILSAIRQKRILLIRFIGRQGKPHEWVCVPYKLEYSAKDDKFRLISANQRRALSINLARMLSCTMLEACPEDAYCPKPLQKRQLTLELLDERNALERAMLHFSHLDKESERIDEHRYRIVLHYEKEDETELLIRVLSFGPVLKVLSPEDFIEKLRQRLERQQKMRTQN